MLPSSGATSMDISMGAPRIWSDGQKAYSGSRWTRKRPTVDLGVSRLPSGELEFFGVFLISAAAALNPLQG